MYCGYCGVNVPMEKLRARCLGALSKSPNRKSEARYICNVCESRITQLRRHSGTWPTDEFNALSQDVQKKFYAAARGCPNAMAVKALLEQTVKEYEEAERACADNGAVQPLSVWAQRGYTEDRFRF